MECVGSHGHDDVIDASTLSHILMCTWSEVGVNDFTKPKLQVELEKGDAGHFRCSTLKASVISCFKRFDCRILTSCIFNGPSRKCQSANMPTELQSARPFGVPRRFLRSKAVKGAIPEFFLSKETRLFGAALLSRFRVSWNMMSHSSFYNETGACL